MSQAEFRNLAVALAERQQPARPARTEQHAARVDAPFEAQIAAFYPYPQSPVDPQPRAAAGDASQRAGGVPGVAAAQRRQSRRGES